MIFGLAGVAGLAGLLLSNPRRKTRKVRRHGRKAVRRHVGKRKRVTRRARKVLRRGAYKHRVMVTKREAAVIRSARSTRMSAIAAKRKLTAIGDQFLGSHYKTNPAYAPMWMTAAEKNLIKSARSAAMKLVSSRRGRRSATALEGTGEGYEAYSMDNPRRRARRRR
jgi:hypothetical protein